MFDWPSFLHQHHIHFVTQGKNTGRGWISIKCPFCGDDPSEHLGIALNGRGWNCLRNQAHRGRRAADLVRVLLHCSPEQAQRIVGEPSLPDDLMGEVRRKLGMGDIRPRELELAPEFKPLLNGSPFAVPFLDYLAGRGYRPQQQGWLAQTYELHYATQGRYAWRIIFPVRDRDGRLLTWTARHIHKHAELRYRSLPRDEQLVATKETLLGLPYLWRVNNPQVLLVCEGPFDATWLTCFGRSFGVYATCLFGLSLSQPQAAALAALQSHFPRVVVLLDRAASSQALRMAGQGLGLQIMRLDDAKDPAELSPTSATELCVSLLN